MTTRPPQRLPVLVALGLALAMPAAASDECRAWPGEPEPLPDTRSADTVSARWAVFRAEELAALAERVEPRSRTVAHSLWRHAACLDPLRDEVAEALERTRPVSVHRPGLVAAAPPAPGPRTSLAAAAASLGRPVPSVGLAPPLPEPDSPLALAELALREARFEEALSLAQQARAELPSDARRTRARLEVLAATAALALGRVGDARASLERALEADPDLELANSPPKVRRLFESVQAARRAPS